MNNRLLILLAVLLIQVILYGCCSCDSVNSYGICGECEKCMRTHVPTEWGLSIQDIKPIKIVKLESIDSVFTWEDVYNKLLEVRKKYLAKLEKINIICEKYSTCKIEEHIWKKYWKNLLEASIKFIKVKNILISRLGYILTLEVMNPETESLVFASIDHIYKDLCIYSNDLVNILEDLNGYKVINIKPQNLQQSLKELENTYNLAKKKREGDSEKSSDEVLELINEISSIIGKIPTVKE